MGIVNVYTRMTRKTEQMDRMMRKLGIGDTMAALPYAPAVMREATVRCLACPHPESCAAWLQEPVGRSGAPAYCRNHDLFEDLVHRSPAPGCTA